MPRYDGQDIGIGLGIIIVLILVIGGLFCIASVNAGNIGISNTFGQVEDIALQPGFLIKAPWTNIINMSIQTEKYTTSATAASADLQDVKTEVTLNYRLKGESAVTMYKTVGMNYADKIIIPAVSESVKANTAKFSATDLIQKRASVKELIEKSINDRLVSYGIVVEAVSITDFAFSAEFTKAIESKVTMQQEAEKAQNELAKIKIEKEQAITRSEAEAQSIKNKADADAYAILASATAEAKAIELKGQQLKQNSQIVSYVAIQKWDGKLPIQMLGSSPVPFIDIAKVQ
jgi:regulator of protease activity HflC (stomatin/prohibitin superfamily)